MHVMYVEKIVTKCAEILLQKCALSQNVQRFCYEMRIVTKCAEILSRNARVVTHCAVVTKCALTGLLCNLSELCDEITLV